MRKAVVTLLAFVCVLTALEAAEVWKQKPVREWTRKETREFLRGSPWVRRVVVGASYDFRTKRSPERTTYNVQPGGEVRTTTEGGEMTSDVTVLRPERVYYVDWTSAQVVRQAISHLRALEGQEKDETETPLAQMHILTVRGDNLTALCGPDEALKASAYLRPDHSKAKISPIAIRVQRQPDGRIVSVNFGFPRQIGGQPSIPDEEESVEFSFKSRGLELKTTFDLSKMTTPQGRDL